MEAKKQKKPKLLSEKDLEAYLESIGFYKRLEQGTLSDKELKKILYENLKRYFENKVASNFILALASAIEEEMPGDEALLSAICVMKDIERSSLNEPSIKKIFRYAWALLNNDYDKAKRIEAKEFKYVWIVFLYKCSDGKVKIFLLKKDDGFVAPFVFMNIKQIEQVKKEFIKTVRIREEDCFPQRFFNWYHTIFLEKKGKLFIVSSTAVRVLDEYREDLLPKKGEWILKNEVPQRLRYSKMFLSSFKKEFGGDSFWECLDTRKH